MSVIWRMRIYRDARNVLWNSCIHPIARRDLSTKGLSITHPIYVQARNAYSIRFCIRRNSPFLIREAAVLFLRLLGILSYSSIAGAKCLISQWIWS